VTWNRQKETPRAHLSFSRLEWIEYRQTVPAAKEEQPMRFLASLLVLAAFAGCSHEAPGSRRTAPIEPETDDSVPVVIEKSPRKLTAQERRELEQAARITHNGATNNFILTNTSGKTLWFDGRQRERPSPIYERLTPNGWVVTWFDWCGTNRGLQPLGPGKSVLLGSFIKEIGRGTDEAAKFVAKGGDLDALPARVGIEVTLDREAVPQTVYSQAVVLARGGRQTD
jgi:hypothetical protein